MIFAILQLCFNNYYYKYYFKFALLNTTDMIFILEVEIPKITVMQVT